MPKYLHFSKLENYYVPDIYKAVKSFSQTIKHLIFSQQNAIKFTAV